MEKAGERDERRTITYDPSACLSYLLSKTGCVCVCVAHSNCSGRSARVLLVDDAEPNGVSPELRFC